MECRKQIDQLSVVRGCPLTVFLFNTFNAVMKDLVEITPEILCVFWSPYQIKCMLVPVAV